MSDNYDSRHDTHQHINLVRGYMGEVIGRLMDRAENHDQSKLLDPELSTFDEVTPLLKETTYGSKEYNALLDRMAPALRHHYAYNDHHPEHFIPGERHDVFVVVEVRFHPSGDEYSVASASCEACDFESSGEEGDVRSAASSHTIDTYKPGGIYAMDLIQLTEMLCDWKAATLRHDDGDLAKSIEYNAVRFCYGEDMKILLTLTASNMGWL